MKNKWLKLVLVIVFNFWTCAALSQDVITPIIPASDKIHSDSTAPVKNRYFPEIFAITTVASILSTINPTISAIIIGGGLGSLSRYTVSQGVSHWVDGSFHGTMAVNIIASFIFGTITGWVARGDSGIANTAWLDLMTTGFLGGFSTFSTFAKDTVEIAREEGILFSALYTGFSVGVSVVAILAGEFVGTLLLP
ncbi:fluoride exporter [Gammaproteobacteria bacterium]